MSIISSRYDLEMTGSAPRITTDNSIDFTDDGGDIALVQVVDVNTSRGSTGSLVGWLNLEGKLGSSADEESPRLSRFVKGESTFVLDEEIANKRKKRREERRLQGEQKRQKDASFSHMTGAQHIAGSTDVSIPINPYVLPPPLAQQSHTPHTAVPPESFILPIAPHSPSKPYAPNQGKPPPIPHCFRASGWDERYRDLARVLSMPHPALVGEGAHVVLWMNVSISILLAQLDVLSSIYTSICETQPNLDSISDCIQCKDTAGLQSNEGMLFHNGIYSSAHEGLQVKSHSLLPCKHDYLLTLAIRFFRSSLALAFAVDLAKKRKLPLKVVTVNYQENPSDCVSTSAVARTPNTYLSYITKALRELDVSHVPLFCNNMSIAKSLLWKFLVGNDISSTEDPSNLPYTSAFVEGMSGLCDMFIIEESSAPGDVYLQHTYLKKRKKLQESFKLKMSSKSNVPLLASEVPFSTTIKRSIQYPVLLVADCHPRLHGTLVQIMSSTMSNSTSEARDTTDPQTSAPGVSPCEDVTEANGWLSIEAIHTLAENLAIHQEDEFYLRFNSLFWWMHPRSAASSSTESNFVRNFRLFSAVFTSETESLVSRLIAPPNPSDPSCADTNHHSSSSSGCSVLPSWTHFVSTPQNNKEDAKKQETALELQGQNTLGYASNCLYRYLQLTLWTASQFYYSEDGKAPHACIALWNALGDKPMQKIDDSSYSPNLASAPTSYSSDATNNCTPAMLIDRPLSSIKFPIFSLSRLFPFPALLPTCEFNIRSPDMYSECPSDWTNSTGEVELQKCFSVQSLVESQCVESGTFHDPNDIPTLDEIFLGKTQDRLWNALRTRFRQLHPYRMPPSSSAASNCTQECNIPEDVNSFNVADEEIIESNHLKGKYAYKDVSTVCDPISSKFLAPVLVCVGGLFIERSYFLTLPYIFAKISIWTRRILGLHVEESRSSGEMATFHGSATDRDSMNTIPGQSNANQEFASDKKLTNGRYISYHICRELLKCDSRTVSECLNSPQYGPESLANPRMGSSSPNGGKSVSHLLVDSLAHSHLYLSELDLVWFVFTTVSTYFCNQYK